jgi:hypothetical protein
MTELLLEGYELLRKSDAMKTSLRAGLTSTTEFQETFRPPQNMLWVRHQIIRCDQDFILVDERQVLARHLMFVVII